MGLGLRRYRTRRQIPIPRGDRFSPPDRDLSPGRAGHGRWRTGAGKRAHMVPAAGMGPEELGALDDVRRRRSGAQSRQGWASGFGDTELGVKYRFLEETDFLPQIGIFPLAELATGDGARGLGNGRTWYQLPVWAQKSWGPWTTYGGGGVVLNPAPSQRDHGFAGWLVQRDIGQHLTLGTELFWQGAETAGGRGSVIANAGGYLRFTESFNLLFSAGRSFSGERRTVWYLGLYWTGGPDKAAGK